MTALLLSEWVVGALSPGDGVFLLLSRTCLERLIASSPQRTIYNRVCRKRHVQAKSLCRTTCNPRLHYKASQIYHVSYDVTIPFLDERKFSES